MGKIRCLTGFLFFVTGLIICFRPCYADEDSYSVDRVANSKGTIESRYVGNKAFLRGSGELESVSGAVSYDSGSTYIDITEIYIEEGITSIKDGAFQYRSIKKIQFPQSLTSIGENVFLDAKVEDEIIVPKNVKKIGANAFNSANIKKLTFENGIKVIGGLQGYRGETFVIPPSVETIEYGAFDGSEIKYIDIPGSVRMIPDYAFAMSYKLERVTLHEGLEVIGDHAFAECANLESINLPHSLKTIKGGAFSICQSLKEITIPGNIKVLDEGLFDCCSRLKKLTIEEGVTEIKNVFCYACDDLDTLVLPSTLKRIGKDAFLECPNLSYVVVPDGVKEIADYALGFLDPSLNSQSVTDTGGEAILMGKASGRIKKKDFVICGKSRTAAEKYAKKYKFKFIDEKYYKKKFKTKHLKYIVSGQGEVKCYGADCKLRSLKIPAKVYYKKRAYKVTGIAARSFMNDKTLNSVFLGSNLTYIGAKAFYKCSKMKRLTIKTKSLKASSVGKAALKGTSRTLTVAVPKKKKAVYGNILKKKGLNKKAKVLGI